MKKVLISSFIVILSLLFIGQIDDELTEDGKTMLSRFNLSESSESYLYLLGIYANEGNSPLEVGKELLRGYQKMESDQDYLAPDYPEEDKIKLPTGELFCRAWEEECISTLFNSIFDIEVLQSDNAILMARSEKWFNLGDYKTLTKPTIYEVYPPYQYIMAAERLRILHAINLAKSGETKNALRSLEKQLSKQRNALSGQDNLIGKLVFINTISGLLDVMSIIGHQSKTNLPRIENLSREERDFSQIAAREFAASYNMYKGLDKHPEFFQVGGNFPGWITRLVFKPNMTINSITPIYTDLTRVAELSPLKFAKEVDSVNNFEPETSFFRNYYGRMLISLDHGHFGYIARFNDLDSKITLLNNVDDDFVNAVNPYYLLPEVELHENKACFSGPLEDKRFLRCLRTKI